MPLPIQKCGILILNLRKDQSGISTAPVPVDAKSAPWNRTAAISLLAVSNPPWLLGRLALDTVVLQLESEEASQRDKSEISHQGDTYLIPSNNVLFTLLCMISFSFHQ